MQSFHPVHTQAETVKQGTSMQAQILEIQDQLQHIKITQYQTVDRVSRLDDKVGRIEKILQQILQQLQQTDMPGTSAKDPAPVSSSEI